MFECQTGIHDISPHIYSSSVVWIWLMCYPQGIGDLVLSVAVEVI
jgi:hypothetical protein